MTAILIDKKKYVLIPEKDYQVLQKKAALKSKPEKAFTLEEARTYSRNLISKWAAQKLFVFQKILVLNSRLNGSKLIPAPLWHIEPVCK